MSFNECFKCVAVPFLVLCYGHIPAPLFFTFSLFLTSLLCELGMLMLISWYLCFCGTFTPSIVPHALTDVIPAALPKNSNSASWFCVLAGHPTTDYPPESTLSRFYTLPLPPDTLWHTRLPLHILCSPLHLN